MTPPDLETPASGARERFYSAGCRAVSNRRLARRADDLTLRGLSSGLGAAAIAARKPSRKNCARPLGVSIKVSENVAPLGRQRAVRSPEERDCVGGKNAARPISSCPRGWTHCARRWRSWRRPQSQPRFRRPRRRPRSTRAVSDKANRRQPPPRNPLRQVAGGGGRASPWASSQALARYESVKYLSSHEM